MSFITPGGVAKRVLGALLFAESSVPGRSAALRSELADMQFTAEYLADFPDALPITGTLSPALTGSNASLSVGNTVVSFDGVGNSASDPEFSFVTGFRVMWEWEVLSAIAPDLGIFCEGGGPFTPDDPLENSVANSFISSTGDVQGFGGAIPANVAPLEAGQILGCVANLNIGTIFFYLNGLPLAQVDILNNIVRAIAGRS